MIRAGSLWGLLVFGGAAFGAACGNAEAVPVPSCDGPAPAPTSGLCPQVYDPVCGCDGVTYGNSCVAEVAGVNIAFHVPCG